MLYSLTPWHAACDPPRRVPRLRYGSNWYLESGDRAKAREIFNKVVSGRAWQAFGYIAAEADLKRGID
jgi:hypothetical protein